VFPTTSSQEGRTKRGKGKRVEKGVLRHRKARWERKGKKTGPLAGKRRVGGGKERIVSFKVLLSKAGHDQKTPVKRFVPRERNLGKGRKTLLAYR